MQHVREERHGRADRAQRLGSTHLTQCCCRPGIDTTVSWHGSWMCRRFTGAHSEGCPRRPLYTRQWRAGERFPAHRKGVVHSESDLAVGLVLFFFPPFKKAFLAHRLLTVNFSVVSELPSFGR